MAELTAEQATALEQLLNITCGSDVERERAILESVNWDVQRAADAIFSGDDVPIITSHTSGAFTVKKEEQMDVDSDAQTPAPPSPNENKPPVKSEIRVKPEPGLNEPNWLTERKPGPAPPNTPKKVKPEPGVGTPAKREPLAPYDANAVLPGGTPKKTRVEPAHAFVKYNSAQEVAAEYTPEKAMSSGLAMVHDLAASVGKLELGSRLRKDVWLKEIDSLKSQGVPRTLIAICGGTGAGKSSCLNAVLGDNIVPTSGMRACTAVVTEISYHDKKTIEADVTFLSRQEWRDEIEVLLTDMVGEDGQLRRLSDLNNEAGIAWHKLHAVCPTLVAETIVQMTPDQIIDRDQRVSKALGTTKNISCPNSRAFAREIGKYIDSKEKKKNKKGEKKTEAERIKENEPAMWPLIKQVRVRCKSRALETGAILVDLPGTQDANTARGAIAKDYMKRCQAIWILAPITRAVDDRTAKELLGDAFKSQLMMDGNYASSCVTFVATKTDDLSCNEIIRAIDGLEDDPDLLRIEDGIQDANRVLKEQRKIKEAADGDIAAVAKEMRKKDEWLDKLKDFLETVQAGGQIAKSEIKPPEEKKEKKKGKKRKSSGKGRRGAKRRKTGDGDMDEFIVDDDEDEEEAESGSEKGDNSGTESEGEEDDASAASGSDYDDDEGSDGDSDDSSAKKRKSKSKSRLTKRKRGSDDDEDYDMDDAEAEEMRNDPDADKDDDDDDEVEEIEYADKDFIDEEIKRVRAELKELRDRKKKMNEGRRAAVSAISEARKNLARLQRDKNCLCSKARNGYSRDALKVDFREGLKEIDEAAALERDPDNFDPSQLLRDYDAIDLPVFTVSSRDYVRITGQVQGDGDPTVFTAIDDTGIPALQAWCHTLTDASRARTAQQYLRQIATFANSVRTYVQSINDVSVVDRVSLKNTWASEDPLSEEEEDEDEDEEDEEDDSDEDNIYQYNRHLQHSIGYSLGGLGGMKLASAKYARQVLGHKAAVQAPPAGQSARQSRKIPSKKGVTDLLIDAFEKVVDESIKGLQKRMNDGLEDKCKTGAEKASDAAVDTSDAFAARMHWATYRATLKRHGAFRDHDLNAELCQPMTSSIASSWSAVFEQDLFGAFEQRGIQAIRNMLDRVEQSAAPGLREKCRAQTDVALRDAKTAMANIVAQVNEAMKTLQKELSRTLAPKIRDELIDGYNLAMEERGLGSVKRQKDCVHNFIDRVREDVFDGGADLLLDGLKDAAKQIGDIMDKELQSLAKKVEVALSVMWDVASDSQKQVAARNETLERVVEILRQLGYWSDAAAMVAAAA